MNQRICSIEGCTNALIARGWCRRHYYTWKRNGDPLHFKRHAAPANALAARTISQGDCLIWTGAKCLKGYGRMRVNGKLQPAHRVAYELEYGPIPEGKVIDHICQNPACCNTAHLRVATIGQNNSHLVGAQKNNIRSGVRNVYYARGKYYVRLRKDGQAHYFGVYPTVAEASEVAERARKDLFGNFAGKG